MLALWCYGALGWKLQGVGVQAHLLRVARGLRASEERLRAEKGEGEEEGDDGEVGDVGERPLDTGRGSVAEVLARCSRSSRWCLKVEDSSRASAERLVVADRLANRALAWLEEDSAPSWGYLRRPDGSRPEKLAARVLGSRWLDAEESPRAYVQQAVKKWREERKERKKETISHTHKCGHVGLVVGCTGDSVGCGGWYRQGLVGLASVREDTEEADKTKKKKRRRKSKTERWSDEPGSDQVTLSLFSLLRGSRGQGCRVAMGTQW
ncbi:hypothetical protein AOLI_G00170820 [Acnodon oligacanthus]